VLRGQTLSTLNKLLSRHPTTAVFVDTKKSEGRKYADLLGGIKFKRIKPIQHQKNQLLRFIQAYFDFKKKMFVLHRTSKKIIFA